MSSNVRMITTARGPLFIPGYPTRVLEAECRSTHETLGRVVRTMANRTVHRDLGVYERAWRPMTHRFGATGSGGRDIIGRFTSGRTIVTSTMENVAPHAGVEEKGRRPGFYVPIDPLEAWVARKGIATGTAARRVAFAISAKHYRLGWPNLGSYQGGQYLGPPEPVKTALDRERGTIEAAYRQLGGRVARRLGG